MPFFFLNEFWEGFSYGVLWMVLPCVEDVGGFGGLSDSSVGGEGGVDVEVAQDCGGGDGVSAVVAGSG